MRNHVLSAAMLAFVAAGCTAYSPPEESGLIGVRPYPTQSDVCQVIGENDITQEYLGDSSILVGCPANERGAIQDRMAEGGVVVENVGSWVLLSIPTG